LKFQNSSQNMFDEIVTIENLKKMAAITEQSFSNWTQWRKILNIFIFSLKLLKHLKVNLAGICIGWSFTKCVFLCVVQKSKMTAIAWHSFNIGVILENWKKYFSLKLEIWLNPNCKWIIIGWLKLKLFHFLCPRSNLTWTLWEKVFYGCSMKHNDL